MDQERALPATTSFGLDEVARILGEANLLVYNFAGTISRWTRGCEQLYGWTAEEAVGKVVHELLATQFSEPLETIRAKLRRQGAWKGELVHRRKDGFPIYVSSRM